MKNVLLLIATVSFLSFDSIKAQSLHIPLSPLQELSQVVGQTKIKLTYSRPSIRERVIFGDLVPYDEMWRTGANRNSKIQFSEPIQIGEDTISAGTYAIITKPSRKTWEVYLYSDTTHWEVPKPWVDSLVAFKYIVNSETTAETVESMIFSLDDLTYNSCNLILAWENTRLKLPLKLFTEDKLQKSIDKILGGPTASDYNFAASAKLQTKKDLDQAMLWIDKAIELRQPISYYDLLIKAEILFAQGKKAKALIKANESLLLAKKTGSKYRIGLVESFLDQLK